MQVQLYAPVNPSDSEVIKRTMNINKQLQLLQLEPFIGRPHSGIDVGPTWFPLGLL